MRSKRTDPDKGTDKRKYPIGPEHYVLYEEVGQGVSASVHRALCVPLDEIVAIKILDFERSNCNLNNVYREAQTMVLIDHPNVLRSHCSFVDDHNLWVVMPFMAGGSCLHILKAAYPDGFGEVIIATILKEVLKGLEYLHRHGHIHRDVKAGNILIDSRGTIKLGDFGVSACLFDSGDRQRTRNTFVGTPCWMAPEVLEQLHGYDFKADIWSFGITALELAHGHAPFSKYPPMKVLLMTLQSAPPGLDYERDRKFSKCFKQMIASCLVKDPTKRPSSKKLLKHSFFKQARSTDYINRKLLDDLPALGERIQALKRKEEDMLAQKKMPDGEKEELSQNEYKRGISGWNFNLDDMKAQASLIQDVEEAISDNNNERCSSSLAAVDGNDKHQFQFSFSSSYPEYSDMEDNDVLQNQSATFPFVDSTRNTNMQKNGRVDDDSSLASSNNEVYEDQHTDSERPGLDIKARSSDSIQRAVSNGSSYSPDGSRPVYKVDSEKIHSDVSSNGNLVSVSSAEDIHSELPPKAKAASVTNGDDVDEKDKSKVHVVQQKGRFKVTSGNVDLEKVPPSPILQKSHSMLVISQHSSRPASPLPSPPCFVPGNSVYGTLQSALQANIQERECILTAMKQVTSGEITGHRGSDLASVQLGNNNYMLERSSLESAHDREKELLEEMTDLQLRLISAQDELKKLKASENI